MTLRVSHILIKHKFEAEDLVRHLGTGRDFAEVAKKYSICPSAKNGGDLGEVEVHRLEETFAQAASKLKPGEISPIVRTPFGYHIIKRN